MSFEEKPHRNVQHMATTYTLKLFIQNEAYPRLLRSGLEKVTLSISYLPESVGKASSRVQPQAQVRVESGRVFIEAKFRLVKDGICSLLIQHKE